jgi:hypothetical protein
MLTMNDAELPPIDDAEVERVRRFVFVAPVSGMTPEMEVNFVRQGLAMQAQARLTNASVEFAVHAIKTLAPSIMQRLGDEYDRETFAAAVARLCDVIRGEAPEATQ